MNRLRLATALAVALLVILLAGDFSGLLHRDVIVEPLPAEERPEQIRAQGELPELPAEAEMPEAKEPAAITEPREPGEAIPDDFPDIPPRLPEAAPPRREPYPWLLPLQIGSAALVIMLGGANLLVWQRKKSMA
jgi:hypothetical protein